MNTKPYLILLASSFGLMILGAVVGGILETSGRVTRETLGPRGVAIVISVYMALFCVAVFAVVPLALRYFISMQIRIGNGGQPLIQWFQAREQTLVHGIWGFYLAGLVVAVVLSRDLILKHFR